MPLPYFRPRFGAFSSVLAIAPAPRKSTGANNVALACQIAGNGPNCQFTNPNNVLTYQFTLSPQ